MLLSVHDVGPRFLPQVERLVEHLRFHADSPALALLVVPDHWGAAPIRGDRDFARWLRRRRDEGAEILLHGWSHRDDSVHATAADRFRAARMTAGEGEFLGLDRAEALRRMREGRMLLEDIAGAPVDGFVAPAWLYGAGARSALGEAGFRIAEDHFRVWNPQDGRILARGPVITWASRSVPRMLSSILFAKAARAVLPVLPTIRIGVHPGDTGALAIMDSIRATVRRFRISHRPSSYADLLRAPSTALGSPVPAR